MELIVLPVSRRATYLTKYLSTYIPGGGIALVFVNPAVTDNSGVHLARSSLAIRHARNVGLVDCARAAARVGSRKDPLEPVCAVSGRRLIPTRGSGAVQDILSELYFSSRLHEVELSEGCWRNV